jgi:hypothetical protein
MERLFFFFFQVEKSSDSGRATCARQGPVSLPNESACGTLKGLRGSDVLAAGLPVQNKMLTFSSSGLTSTEWLFISGYTLDLFSKQYWTAGVRFMAGAVRGFFLYVTASRPALGPVQPPLQWVPWTLSRG